MLGMFSDYTPKFVKRYAEIGKEMTDAFKAYISEVQEGSFPAPDKAYTMDESLIEKLY